MTVLAVAGIPDSTLVTLVVLAVLLMGTFAGLGRGLIVEVTSTAGVIIALAVARVADGTVRGVLAPLMRHSHWLGPASYLITFAIIWAAILILARGLRRFARLTMLGPIDRLGGGIIAFLQSALVLAMLLALARRAPIHALRAAVSHSAAAHVLLHAVPAIRPLLPYLH